MIADRQNAQADRHADHNTPLPIGGAVNINTQLVCYEKGTVRE